MTVEHAPREDAWRGACHALFEAECAYVLHSLRRLGVPHDDCADVAHEVFLVAFRLLPACDRTRPMRPWLFGIAYRVAAAQRRLARVRREVPSEDLERPDHAAGADEQLDQRRRERLVQEALGALDLERRAVFVMHDIDGHPMPEIAEVLGIPLNTGYSRLRLAREAFAARIKRQRREIDG